MDLQCQLLSGKYSGILPDMPSSEYHGLSQYFSSSDLKYMYSHSPKHFHDYHFGTKLPKKPTDKMILGSVVHSMFLTPSLVEKEFFELPFYDGRTKIGKEIRDKALEACGDKVPVDVELWNNAEVIAGALKEKFYPWMKSYESELSFFWTCPYSGLPFRGRADAVMGDTLIELKTTDNCEPIHFSRHSYNLNYDLSVAHYLEGLRQNGREIKKVVFLVAETGKPFVCEKYVMADEFVAVGHEKWLSAVNKVEAGIKEGRWPGYHDDHSCDEMVLLPPPFAKELRQS